MGIGKNEWQVRVPAAKKESLQTKTFVYDIEAVASGAADDEVNAFARQHNVVSIVFDRAKAQIIYRVLYRA